ncbi:MAG: hypothetical protein OEY77_00055 [Nitrospira sp.]|nr:hypothetical protein [Nitrospira sp.]
MMGQLGEALQKSQGKKIVAISLENDQLRIQFKGHALIVQESEAVCCESRYMVCDDKLENFIGATLIDLTIENVPAVAEDACGYEHEVEFMHVKTSKGSFTVSNHNQHNGNYGGFSIRATVENIF